MAEGWPKQRRLLGTKIERLDGPDKATGKAKYSYDVNRPGMLHAKMLRSPHAHAKIKSIDTSAARTAPGVKAVAVAIPGVVKDGKVAEVNAAAGTLVVAVPVGKKKEQKHTIQVTPAVTILKANKPAKLADLKVGDAVSVEAEQDIVGHELLFAGEEIIA